MINDALRCPNCGELGFIEPTEEADLGELVGAVCHYCGHLLDRQALLDCLAATAAERQNRPRLP